MRKLANQNMLWTNSLIKLEAIDSITQNVIFIMHLSLVANWCVKK